MTKNETTLGKTVTLGLGAVVTDIGPGRANGEVDENFRTCVTDDGVEYLILARVIRDLPVTHRRDEL